MPTESEPTAPAHRASAAIFILLGVVFVWTAVLTYSPLDWPSPKITPHPWPPHNACGRAGALVAYHLFHSVGQGAYVLTLAMTAASFLWLMRGRLTAALQRAFGTARLLSN